MKICLKRNQQQQQTNKQTHKIRNKYKQTRNQTKNIYNMWDMMNYDRLLMLNEDMFKTSDKKLISICLMDFVYL